MAENRSSRSPPRTRQRTAPSNSPSHAGRCPAAQSPRNARVVPSTSAPLTAAPSGANPSSSHTSLPSFPCTLASPFGPSRPSRTPTAVTVTSPGAAVPRMLAACHSELGPYHDPPAGRRLRVPVVPFSPVSPVPSAPPVPPEAVMMDVPEGCQACGVVLEGCPQERRPRSRRPLIFLAFALHLMWS